MSQQEERTPYYQDQIFENKKYQEKQKSEFDPLIGVNQDGQQTKGYNKKKFYIRPFTVYNYSEKQLFTLRPRNSIYQNQADNIMTNKRVGYLIMKITPMVEEKGGNSDKPKHVPDYEASLSFVLTSKNIGGILAVKATNSLSKHEMKEQVLESTTKKSQTDDYLTLLKIEKKLKQEPTDDRVEFELTYFEAKDDQLIRSSSVTLTLGQMTVFKLLCKKFLNENINGWGILNRQ